MFHKNRDIGLIGIIYQQIKTPEPKVQAFKKSDLIDLKIQILDTQGIGLDKLAAWLYDVAHEFGE